MSLSIYFSVNHLISPFHSRSPYVFGRLWDRKKNTKQKVKTIGNNFTKRENGKTYRVSINQKSKKNY